MPSRVFRQQILTASAKLIPSVAPKYTKTVLKPEFDDWSEWLSVSAPENPRLAALRQTARQRLIESSQQYVLRLNTLAEDAELPELKTPLLTGDPSDSPIVMTGHQPVLFHSGLTFKYEKTRAFADDHSAIGVAVIIDTDQGDAGQFAYPTRESAMASDSLAHDFPILAIETLAESHNLYAQGKLKSPAEIRQIGQAVAGSLRDLKHEESALQAEQIFERYVALAATKATALEANTLLRWHFGIGSGLLELPLSAIASFPEILKLTTDILKQPHRFAAAYNSALQTYREEHQIRNAANPFPDLRIEQDRCELPFWVVNHNRGTRYVLEVRLDGNVTELLANETVVDTFAGNINEDSLEPMLLQNLQIVPRGALITAYLRLLFSDLFVHGTGGARYDRFTDEFIRSWWNTDSSPFTVATASRFLFSEQRGEIERLKQIETDLRDLRFNPQRFFGAGVFEPELEERLVALMKDKQAAVDCMKSFHADGHSAKEAGKEIQKLTKRIRDAVDAGFESQLQLLKAVTPEQLDAINSRTYPWFFFKSH